MALQVLRQHLAACGQHHQTHAQAHQQTHQGFSPLLVCLTVTVWARVAECPWATRSEPSSTLGYRPVKLVHAECSHERLTAASSDPDRLPDRPRC
jgi:hypothetical protein